MSDPQTLPELLARGAPDDVAIAGENAAPLTYGALRGVVAEGTAALAGLGLGPGDRVAMVMPNGPAAAVSFLTVASTATACPLNPAYTADEFRFFLGDLKARAVIVPAAGAEPAIEQAAAAATTPLVHVHPVNGAAGAIRFEAGSRAERGTPRGEHEALALHTSGTTARPKLVPLSHGNLSTSAGNIAAALRLAPSDRCLCAMPLFHVHGLVAAVLSSLAAGASVWCAPAFNPLRFYGWLAEAGATWMTAVPTMYQAILARAPRNREAIEAHPLRLLRSSSAAMPPSVLARLEETFKAPVVESYGMTEASQQICSNPVPPGVRKPGSVGPAAGPDIAILDASGVPVPAGGAGEVAIRGGNVMAGYADNPAANEAAFTGGWFRTGDWGSLDGDGYLTLYGRIKEIINRGGEKISPADVEDVLLGHAGVAEAAVFAVPHPSLGDDVGAAVVAAGVTGAQLRAYAAERLAPFKVPRTIVLVDELPKGPTGKVSRTSLAERLGLGELAP